MILDDRERPGWGVGVFARSIDGKVRIVLDDLQRLDDPGALPRWEMWAFLTHRDCDRESFLAHGLSRDDYEALGRTVMARLVALQTAHGDPKPPKSAKPPG